MNDALTMLFALTRFVVALAALAAQLTWLL
jgi:hypothetical protein